MSHKGPRKAYHHKIPNPTPTAYAGSTTCLRCEKTFESWDRRQNRLCPNCLEAINREPSEEPHVPFRAPTRRGRNRDEG
jgi:predicted amidophosphoribosyltransferase